MAVTAGQRLEEYYVERGADSRLVGSIYKGRITSVVPGIGAAFVDIGLGKNGFLYVSDIIEPRPEEDDILEGEAPAAAPRPQPPRRHFRIEEVVKPKQDILVQVVKEPFGTKGARLTTHLSLPGRYMVLMPNDPRVGVSKRIADGQERGRLKDILNKIRFSHDVGLIVRTAGEGKDEKDLARDVRYLSHLYQQIKQRGARAKAPSCLYQEYELSHRVLRDSLADDVKTVLVDSKDEFHRLRRFLSVLMPGGKVPLEWYRDEEPLFEHAKLEEQIAGLFDKRVTLPSGGSIVVEPTEGLVAIDVNTAKFTGRRNLEDTAFQVDKEAAVEVARQLRLRDIGGIVVIDFIDLENPANRHELVKVLEDELAKDRSKTNLVSFSEICVAELTRQRMRRSVETVSHETCPYCQGRGTVKSSTTMAIETVRQVRRVLKDAREKTLEVLVHPQVAVRLLQEHRPSLSALEAKSHSKLLILSDPSLHLEQVQVRVAAA